MQEPTSSQGSLKSQPLNVQLNQSKPIRECAAKAINAAKQPLERQCQLVCFCAHTDLLGYAVMIR